MTMHYVATSGIPAVAHCKFLARLFENMGLVGWVHVPVLFVAYNLYPICRAMVYLSHGVTEHMGRYAQFATLLADSGLCVFGHDHGGDGKGCS